MIVDQHTEFRLSISQLINRITVLALIVAVQPPIANIAIGYGKLAIFC